MQSAAAAPGALCLEHRQKELKQPGMQLSEKSKEKSKLIDSLMLGVLYLYIFIYLFRVIYI
jgi:hypothetical protein